jgi:nucleoid-associated protein YgaU
MVRMMRPARPLPRAAFGRRAGFSIQRGESTMAQPAGGEGNAPKQTDFSNVQGGGGPKKADFSNVQTGVSSTAPEAGVAARTHTVASGDTLSKIARHHYGDAGKWRAIFEANRDQIKDPDLIHPGQVLTIPNDV